MAIRPVAPTSITPSRDRPKDEPPTLAPITAHLPTPLYLRPHPLGTFSIAVQWPPESYLQFPPPRQRLPFQPELFPDIDDSPEKLQRRPMSPPTMKLGTRNILVEMPGANPSLDHPRQSVQFHPNLPPFLNLRRIPQRYREGLIIYPEVPLDMELNPSITRQMKRTRKLTDVYQSANRITILKLLENQRSSQWARSPR